MKVPVPVEKVHKIEYIPLVLDEGDGTMKGDQYCLVPRIFHVQVQDLNSVLAV